MDSFNTQQAHVGVIIVFNLNGIPTHAHKHCQQIKYNFADICVSIHILINVILCARRILDEAGQLPNNECLTMVVLDKAMYYPCIISKIIHLSCLRFCNLNFIVILYQHIKVHREVWAASPPHILAATIMLSFKRFM
ncbi:hypothetical protein QTP88_025773 [Uroleucon formosanum]